ncbi:hypothetical protein QP938_03405 [Porticoccaceae bacterium LTM1]|nr:hypothetical protein QP938_03405 [Porticoccaceae bacterium LTM1]
MNKQLKTLSKIALFSSVVFVASGNAAPPDMMSKKVGDSCRATGIYSGNTGINVIGLEFFSAKGPGKERVELTISNYPNPAITETYELPPGSVTGSFTSGLSLSVHTDELGGDLGGMTGLVEIDCIPMEGGSYTKTSGSQETYSPYTGMRVSTVGTTESVQATQSFFIDGIAPLFPTSAILNSNHAVVKEYEVVE